MKLLSLKMNNLLNVPSFCFLLSATIFLKDVYISQMVFAVNESANKKKLLTQ